ncbi:HSP90 family protein [Microbacterium sorbitolivorans]|uniref:HSP90 family protein n=1 Tax=Microbacterium sorbitolivorans TaxID=1867410 RepID=A0A367Y4V9_9MICO|nr:HSP90 family protein [Microbacterium sorbitolivorans]RCK60092.1 HSP90 family protein [Microbacterium sorbitolivorans]GGF42711.1 HSP90 family protein [Microbacterium sorbitolivorans]
MTDTTARPFQVDLRGVVDLLGRHIYSSPQVFLRELLQNGRDAIRARHDLDPSAPAGTLDIVPAGPGEFRFRDDGVGLTADEAAELLSTVGRSSKRDDVLGERREGYLGQFGIGLLSCFMVSDRIHVTSRSAKGAPAIEWVGDASGEFRIRELGEAETAALPIGTEIVLAPRPDDAAMLAREQVTALADHFGRYLPVAVRVQEETGSWRRVSREPEFLTDDREQLLAFGEQVLGARPLDAIRLNIEGTATRGVAYVLPYAPPPGARQANTVYLGRMLVSEHVDDMLPEWAFFVRAVLDTTGLAPTASRESFVDSPALEHTREEIGSAVRAWILEQARAKPWVFQRFLGVHHLALKAMTLGDDEFARTVLPWLPVETSAGDMTIGELAERYGGARYTESVDEFRQIAAVARDGYPVVNGGYVHQAAIMRRLPVLLDLPVSRASVNDILDDLAPVPLDDRARAVDLETRATTALADVGCAVTTRQFAPEELPALVVVDPEVQRRIDREQVKGDIGGGLWGGIVGSVGDLIDKRRSADPAAAQAAQLCLNWRSPLVKRLAHLGDELVLSRTVRLLYVQALLASQRPLQANDRRILTQALGDMVSLSAGFTDHEGGAL